MLIQEGINIDPILQSTGNSIGKSIFDKLYDDEIIYYQILKEVGYEYAC